MQVLGYKTESPSLYLPGRNLGGLVVLKAGSQGGGADSSLRIGQSGRKWAVFCPEGTGLGGGGGGKVLRVKAAIMLPTDCARR